MLKQSDAGSLSARADATPHVFRYRRDIDGLRAIAVLSVVLFHLGTGMVPGGYAGVDVFFVISGYLITGHIDREIAEGSFTIGRFYERRIRRIFAALIAMLAVVAVVGFAVQYPDDLRDLGASIVAAAAFGSNILFWMTTDYFAGPAETKPLLHTWSLAVEEQFYIVVPILLMALHRFAPRRIGVAMLVLTLVSFGLSCAWVWIDPTGNYYLPHTRAWELLLGSLVALGMAPRIRNALVGEVIAGIALLMLLAPFFLLTSASTFPAWNALATCIGTALLIHVGDTHSTAVSRLLGLKPMVAVGLISYSLYLVHWPVIVFAHYLLLRDPTGLEIAGMAVLMLVLAYGSWRFIERPFRDRRAMPARRLVLSAAIGTGLVVIVGAGYFATKGLPQRLDAAERRLVREDGRQGPFPHCLLKGSWRDWNAQACTLTPGEAKGPVVVLWGDSHAYHYVHALIRPELHLKAKVLLYASAACPPVLGIAIDERPFCQENNERIFEIVRGTGAKRVVLSGYWERNLTHRGLTAADVGNTVRRLREAGVEVAIMGDNPDFPVANPEYLALRLNRRDDRDAPYYAAVRNSPRYNQTLAGLVDPKDFFDPMAELCRGEECLAFENGQLMMSDNAHLSTYGAMRVMREARGIFEGE